MVYDIFHTRALIPEPCTTDEPDKAVAPAGFPFPVHKDPKAVLKTESLEAADAALVFERACHFFIIIKVTPVGFRHVLQDIDWIRGTKKPHIGRVPLVMENLHAFLPGNPA